MTQYESNKETRMDRLEEAGVDVAKYDDPDYRTPSEGGCWICNRGNGHEDDEMSFSIDYDTFYHDGCLDQVGCKSILEYEREF